MFVESFSLSLKYTVLNLCYNHIRFMLDSYAIIYYTLELTASQFMAYSIIFPNGLIDIYSIS